MGDGGGEGEQKKSPPLPRFARPLPLWDLCINHRMWLDISKMKGGDVMSQRSNEQLSMADGLCHRSIGVNEALLRIGELIDWQAMGVELEKVHDRSGGAPSYPALLMFKALLLQ